MTIEERFEAIYQAKVEGLSDAVIMERFSVGLRDIEEAVIKKTGLNLNLYRRGKHSSKLAPKEFSLETTSVWSFKNRGKWATHSGNYRGNWSPYIPRNLILRFSQPGDLILDQFCGGGTTAVEAKLLGRRCIARDINPDAVLLTRRNVDFTVHSQKTLDNSEQTEQHHEPAIETGDARSLSGIDNESVDLICTHPPYANIVQYTDGIDGDISQHDVDEFIADMKQVARESYRVLKSGKVCSVLIGDTRRNKRVVPIGFRTIETFLEAGFALQDLVIKRQHNCRTDGFWYSSSIKYNFLLLAQEYLPIFVKPRFSEQIIVPESKKVSFNMQEIMQPPPPEKMQCRTTWVLPADCLEEVRDANIASRYNKDEDSFLKISISETGDNRWAISKDNMYKLVYIDVTEQYDCLEKLTSVLIQVTSHISRFIEPNGHLVLRLKDHKRGSKTLSSALRSWRIPMRFFHIREIIVVTPTVSKMLGSANTIETMHEYLLVYQRFGHREDNHT